MARVPNPPHPGKRDQVQAALAVNPLDRVANAAGPLRGTITVEPADSGIRRKFGDDGRIVREKGADALHTRLVECLQGRRVSRPATSGGPGRRAQRLRIGSKALDALLNRLVGVEVPVLSQAATEVDAASLRLDLGELPILLVECFTLGPRDG